MNAKGQSDVFFESLFSLRERYQKLVDVFEKEEATDQFLQDLEEFVTRGRQIGAVLETGKERVAAQGLLDYWAATFYRLKNRELESTLADFDFEQQLKVRSTAWQRSGRRAAELLPRANLAEAEKTIGAQGPAWWIRVLGVLPNWHRGAREQWKAADEATIAFVAASRRRALRFPVAVAALLIVLVIVVSWLGYEKRLRSREQYFHNLVAKSASEKDPVESRKLALRVYEEGAPREEAEGALRVAIQKALPRKLAAFRDWTQSVAFSPDGKFVAVGSQDGSVEILYAPSGFDHALPQIEKRTKLPENGRLPGAVVALAFSKDKKLAVASGDKIVRIWDIPDLDKRRDPVELAIHGDVITCVAFSPNGEYLTSASYDGSARVWDVQSRRPIGHFLPKQTRIAHTFAITAVVFLDNDRVVTGSRDGQVVVWNWMNNNVRSIDARLGPITALAFTTNSNGVDFLAIMGASRAIKIFDPASGLEFMQFQCASWPNAIALDPSASFLGAAEDEGVEIWSLERGTAVAKIESNPQKREHDAFTNLSFSRYGTRVATTGTDGTLRLYTVYGLEPEFSDQAVREAQLVYGLTFIGEGDYLATATALENDATIRIWKRKSNREWENRSEIKSEHKGVFRLAVAGNQLVSGNRDGTFEVRDPHDPAKLKAFTVRDGHAREVHALAYSSKNHWLAAGELDGSVGVWDAASWEQIGAYKQNRGVVDLAFSDDGATLASAGYDGTVRLWNPKNTDGKEEEINPFCTLTGSTDPVRALAFFPIATNIVTASSDGWVRLFNIASCDGTIDSSSFIDTRRPDRVTSMAVQPAMQGNLLAAVSKDGTVKLMGLEPGGEKQTPLLSFVRPGVSRVAISPDGKLLATTSDDGWLDIFPVGTDEMLGLVNEQIDESKREKATLANGRGTTASHGEAEAARKLEAKRALARNLDTNETAKVIQTVADVIQTVEEVHRRFPKYPISPEIWNLVCWRGSTAEMFIKDVFFACDAAVAQAPERLDYRDARGIALARDRKFSEAIIDFHQFLSAGENASYAEKRTDWLKTLKQNRDPFTPDVLKKLATER